jgi:glutathione S-transferase
MNLLINSEDTAAYLAKKFGVPDTLIRDLEERRQMMAMAQQMAMQQQMSQPQGGEMIEPQQ